MAAATLSRAMVKHYFCNNLKSIFLPEISQNVCMKAF